MRKILSLLLVLVSLFVPLFAGAQSVPTSTESFSKEVVTVPERLIPVFLFADESGGVLGVVPLAEDLFIWAYATTTDGALVGFTNPQGSEFTNATSTESQSPSIIPLGIVLVPLVANDTVSEQSSEPGAGVVQRKFTGHEYDRDTALTYANARYYKQNVGRFLNQDPLFLNLGAQSQAKLRENLGNPQGLNSYAYSFNNPLRYVDVTGGKGYEFTRFLTTTAARLASDYLQAKSESLTSSGHSTVGSIVGTIANKLDTYATAFDPSSSPETSGEALRSLAGDVYIVAGFVEPIAKAFTPWKVGDPINAPTRNGYPSWSTARQRYWKNEAVNNPGKYTTENLERMQKGLAPKTEMGESIELHHTQGRDVPDPHNIENLQPVTPQQHSDVDPYRHLPKGGGAL